MEKERIHIEAEKRIKLEDEEKVSFIANIDIRRPEVNMLLTHPSMPMARG